MKGFIKTFEAIMASVIILVSLTYFFTATPRTSGWGDAFLQTEVEDALVILHKSGELSDFVKNNDAEGLNTRLKEMLTKTIDFSPVVSGTPKTDIYISVIGDTNDENNLKAMLGDTLCYNSKTINLYITEASWDNIDPETNIIFLFGYEDLSFQIDKVNEFLRNSTTIFMFGDLGWGQVNDGILNNLFGLTWDDVGVPSSTGNFHEYENPNITSFRISNYLRKSCNNSRSIDFNGFYTTSRIQINDKTVVESNDQLSSFASINEYVVDGKGRTVWLNGYDFLSTGENIEILNNLTKSIIMWASGESYKMNYPYEKSIPDVYSTASFIVPGEESYEVKILFWRILY